ncbi:aminoglycoside phosphotransferase family protein [Paenibacillus sp. H1-7]|uniref:aminoglycoside phosphotransferase family protein n=1 Tax=Paenibacillus sp. H1-7 TaxID=2282849 RepID=UPI001EF76833|nr:aminoglycoside phosphotransferase family protein [Paenibacillus sp. H1-7]ULL16011.1 aminoglycoside phosphotransferase family protein [Paenibacillus sp. H1-7]
MNNLHAILKTHYDLDITGLKPMQGGWAALAFRVYDNSHAYFLKMYEQSRASTSKWTQHIDDYVPIMVWLHQHSRLKHKIPVPVITQQGEYKVEDDEGVYLLYEYIDGATIGETSLSKQQVIQLSEIIAELHRYGDEIPVPTDALREDFTVLFLHQLRLALNEEFGELPDDVSITVEPYRPPMNALMDTLDSLSGYLKGRTCSMALCHTDIHNWNMMQSGQQLMLIDWEGLKLAPVEADFMFLTDQPYYDAFLDIYRNVHPGFELCTEALQFYKYKRLLEDIWEFMEQLMFDKQTADERAATLNSLQKELNHL